MKKTLTFITALLLAIAAIAQTGGIRGTVIDRSGRQPISGALVEVRLDGEKVAGLTTGSDGAFLFERIADGRYSIAISATGFTASTINVIVERGLMRDLVYVSLSAEKQGDNSDADVFAEFDLDDSGYNDSPTLLSSSNDVYNDMVSFGFSAIRFKNRGYDSESQKLMFAGVPMNDAITGYSSYSLWTGINEATRSQDSTIGLETSDYGIGGYNGTTNILGMPDDMRTGWRFSLLSNSASYRLRIMTSYASGRLDNGWAYAFNASARLGGNDWVKGVYYRNFALYAGVSKVFDDIHKLSLIAFATPGSRGAQNSSTQEVYDLMGDNMYNSNWGYQGGKIRNSRVRKTFEPVVTLKYDYTPSDEFSMSASLLYRTGFNGYTALDWYDAQDPRPDYYRNLPSYAYIEDSDYNRANEAKAGWMEYAWTHHTKEYAKYQHLDWDRLYNVNYNNLEGRSKYALEERHVDQNDLNLSARVKWSPTYKFTLRGGLNLKWNRTENYKKVNDLLGGQYFLNIDSFAERDFASNKALLQNDLDYFLAHGEAEKIVKGGKYGYDYLAQVRRAGLWLDGQYTVAGFTSHISANVGYESFWRDGLVRKGLFAGLDSNGQEIIYDGKVLTTYGPDGRPVTSFGKSDISRFLTYGVKVNLAYELTGGHRFSVNAGWFNDAPTFNQAFVSARTRNTIMDGLTTVKTLSVDGGYQYSNNGYRLRLTGFYTKIMDQSNIMSFYDDSQQSFTNFAMSGIDQRHVGLEFGAEVPLFVSGLSLAAAVSFGEYVYTSNPHMVQTMDNSTEIIRNEDVPYWKSHPIFKSAIDPDTGNKVYLLKGGLQEATSIDDYVQTGTKKHYVPSTPQLATSLSLKYNFNYWFLELNGQYFAKSHLDMNPLYRTAFACGGGDGIVTPEEVEYMTAQEEFKSAVLLNFSVGKSWYINYKYNIGFSLQANNLLNNRNVKTGGYEQTRLISSYNKDRYYRFDPKYFYMQGINYMVNVYFRF